MYGIWHRVVSSHELGKGAMLATCGFVQTWPNEAGGCITESSRNILRLICSHAFGASVKFVLAAHPFVSMHETA